jgi:phosphoribosylglycinamide formyltransferase-1
MKQEKKRLRLAVLISGSGRTLKNFIELSAADKLPVEIPLVLSSNSQAGGLEHAHNAGIESQIFLRNNHDTDEAYGHALFGACRQAQVDYVAMAGFLKLAPLPDDFIGRVLNIHPSLIPSFCGQGMYGHHVHQAVLESGVKVTGVTVHFVDNQYDGGPIIWQQPIPVFEDDSVDSLANRVFEAEKEVYPQVLRQLAAGKIWLEGGRVRGQR